MMMRVRALLVLVASAVAMVAMAAARARAQEEDPDLQQIAAAYYAERHHLDLDQARERLAIQDAAAGIEDDLTRLLGGEFAGIWYDAADRGRLKVGLTDAGREQLPEIQRLLQQYGVDADSDLVSVRFSEDEIVALQARVRQQVLDLIRSGHVATAYDTRVNSVVLTALVRLPPDEEARVRRVAALSGVELRRTQAPSLLGRLTSCNITYCDAPLRGGRQIAGSSGTCTAAFMARGRTNPDQRFAMTAGHCNIFGGPFWSARDEGNVWHGIGSNAVTQFSGAPGLDAGVIAIPSTSFWAFPDPAPLVVVKKSDQTTYNPSYPIKSDSKSSMGQVLCRTGEKTGTHCAEVSGLGADHSVLAPDGNSYLLLNLGELDMCAALPGDSGGPIYKRGRAYGIHSSSIAYPPFTCMEVYQGVRAAENAMNVDVLVSP